MPVFAGLKKEEDDDVDLNKQAKKDAAKMKSKGAAAAAPQK